MHSTQFWVPPPPRPVWGTLHLFKSNPFVIEWKSKAIPSFSMVSSLIFPFYKLIKFVGHSIHVTLNHIIDCLYCLLNGHLLFNVSMHVSFLHIDHEISEGKNTESNCVSQHNYKQWINVFETTKWIKNWLTFIWFNQFLGWYNWLVWNCTYSVLGNSLILRAYISFIFICQRAIYDNWINPKLTKCQQ